MLRSTLSNFQVHSTYCIINYSHQATHWVPGTHCSYKSKFVLTYIPFFLFLPPTQPMATTILLSVSRKVTFFLPHIRDTIQYLPFCAWLIWLSKMPSSFIHIVTNGRILFSLWLDSIPLYIYVSYSLYPFSHLRTLRLFPYLICCEQIQTHRL